MTTKADLHDKTTLTRCYSNRGYDRATRSVYEDGLSDSRTNLKEAITAIKSSLGDNHPDDTTLPLDTISVHYFSNDKVFGLGHYRRPYAAVDLSRAAKAQTTRRAGTDSIHWWRDTTSFDSDGLPNGDITFEPYADNTTDEELRPRPWSLTVGVQVIEMPTLISDHPSTLFLDRVGKVNSGTDLQFLATGGFPAGTLLFDGWTSRYVGSGLFYVVYRAIYMKQKWPFMSQPIYNTTDGEWQTTIQPMYDSTAFGSLPVHTVIT